MSATVTEIQFESGEFTLTGMLHLPEGESAPVVIGSHGLLSDADSEKQIQLAEALLKEGIGYFRFHHRGCGTSGGELKDASLETRTTDLLAAWDMLSRRKDVARPFGLFGSSMGSATCINAWSAIRPAATVLVAPPVLPDTLGDEARLSAMMEETGLPESFFANHFNMDFDERLPGLRNVFVFHGTDDEVVPFDNGRQVYEMAAEPKKLIALEGGDHRISLPGHQKIFVMKAVQWYADKMDAKPRTCGE